MMRFLFILLIGTLALGGSLSAQPFYDVEVFPVCYDSAGTQVSLQSYNLYVMGRNDVVHRLYIDEDGDKVVPGGGATLYDVPCSHVITADTAAVVFGESSFALGPWYIIPADTYDIVSLYNAGIANQTVLISGNSYRMVPGESYNFVSTFDEETGEVVRNPTISITNGVTGRVLVFIIFGFLGLQIHGQPGINYDIELTRICLVDSIAPDTVNQFWRFTHSNSPGTFIRDVAFDLSGPYTVAGTLKRCCDCLTDQSASLEIPLIHYGRFPAIAFLIVGLILIIAYKISGKKHEPK